MQYLMKFYTLAKNKLTTYVALMTAGLSGFVGCVGYVHQLSSYT